MAPMRGDARAEIARRRLRGLLLRGPRPATPAEVVRELLAMQSQEDRYARWSVAQRMAGGSAAVVEAALAEGSILRTHVLRPTWHYVARQDLRWLMALSGPRVDRRNARRHQELGLDDAALGRSNDVIARAVSEGPHTRPELATLLEAKGISTEGQRIAYMVLHAELTAVVCSGPPRSRQHTYAAFDDRVPPDTGPEGEAALAELARRYFSARGPATVGDFSWWSGLTAPEARRALAAAAADLESMVVDHREYWLGDVDGERDEPGIDLVQCFDEIIISFRPTRDVLQTDTVAFAVPGDVDGFRHVMLHDGRLLGHWRSPAGRAGLVETRLAAEIDVLATRLLDAAVERSRRFFRELEAPGAGTPV